MTTLRAAVLLLIAFAPLDAQRVSSGQAGSGPTARPDPARDAELHRTTVLTTGVREDDHPALAVDGLRLWVAWVSYSEGENADRVFLREFDGSRWQAPVEAADGPGDYYKPAIAADGRGSVWVVWPAQSRGNWDLYGRERRSDRWGPIERLTSDPGPDLDPQLAGAGDQLWLVWQAMRKGNSDILYRVRAEGEWARETPVTMHPANDWSPVVKRDSNGGIHVAWDSYRAGNYDVYLRTFAGGRWSPELAVAAGPQLEARPALAAGRNGAVWITWEVGPENWAGDSANGGLRVKRSIGLACLAGGRLHRAAQAERGLAGLAETGVEAAAPAVDSSGRLWLLFRSPVNNNFLRVAATRWESGQWAKPDWLIHSEGRVDQRIAAAQDASGGVVACYPAGSLHSLVYLRRFPPAAATGDSAPPLEPAEAAPAPARANPPIQWTSRGRI